jgi:predicted transposase/invertase (TIGR01784 family)
MADKKKEPDETLSEILMERERYINPYTDFGFKKLFGTEMNKDLLISFLNALFNNEEKEIEDVQYLNSEHLGDGYGDRRAVFDVYCKTKDGGRFIVEMQKAEQTYFKDRSLYYSTFAIREQAPKGKDWDYHLEDVYTVGVLNFKFPGDEYPADSYRHEIKLKDVEDNHVFYPKLTFVYLEMPKFNKTEDELVTMFDKWMFVLRNLSRLLDRPKALQDRIFDRLFEQAEIAKYSPAERREYEVSVKNYWDYNSTMKTAATNASNERAKKIARRMKAGGMTAELIAKYTGLTTEEIEGL